MSEQEELDSAYVSEGDYDWLCQICRKCGSVGHTVDFCEKSEGGDKNPETLGENPKEPSNGISQQVPAEEEVKEDPKTPRRRIRNKKRKSDSKQRSWNEVAETRIETLNLGPVDRFSILEHLLLKVRTDMEERYSSVFECDVARILEDSLSPAVKEICEHGRFDLNSLLAIGQDPESMQECGIYLHILWVDEGPQSTRFWLYVGQACVLCVRIQKHNDPIHRRRNMGLHYSVWQSKPVMKSAFVTLAVLDKPTCARTQLMLNLAEMWGCLIFQTLTSIHLDSWLPGKTAALWSGHHLNVALPLWQGFTDTSENQAISDAIGGRVTFQGFLASSDPVIRAWAEETRDAFNDIRNSPDPNIREYWWSLHQSRILKSQKTWADKKAEVALRHLEGAEAVVTSRPITANAGTVNTGSFQFTIPQSLGLDLQHRDKIILKYHLSDTPHPNKYATEALTSDPASRLGVSISGQDSHGPFFCWLNAKGDTNARKMNTLVDLLEGLTAEETKGFTRRWFIHKSSKNQSKGRHVYT